METGSLIVLIIVISTKKHCNAMSSLALYHETVLLQSDTRWWMFWSIWAALWSSPEIPVWGTCCWERPTSLPAALQCKASSTSHFTRTYLGLRWPSVCKTEKYAYAQNPKIKKSVVCSCVSPFALTNPWAGTLCERVCVGNCVGVSTPSGGGWKLPTPAASSVPPACPAPHSWA